MALQYSPKIVTDSLVMCLDASNNKSYPTDLPLKDQLNLWLDAADDTTFSYSSGTTVSQWRDKSGRNNHAIVMAGSPLRSVAINSRKAVSFTSTTAFKCLTGLFSSTATHIVVCRATTSSATYQRVYHGGANSDFYVFIGAYTDYVATFWGSGPNVWFDTNPNSPSTTILNTLRIISAVNNGTTATPYYDGTAMSTKVTTNSAAYTGYELNTYSNGAPYQPLIGEVCEIIVFNKQLSAIELKQVHTYLGQKWGISNTDRSIVDLSNNNNHGLLGGLPGSQVVADMPLFDIYNKGALKLDGSTDYISVENATSLNPTTVTVSIWVKRNGYQSSIASYLRRNYNDSYGITGDIASDNVRFRIYNGSAYPESPNATLSLNEWTNIVGTYDLANIKIYKNGVFVNQTAHTSAISYASANTTLTIGRDDPVAGRYMNANYGSVLIYSRALSAAEVLQNYEAQKSKFANTIVQQGLVLNLDAGNPYSYAGAGTTWYDVTVNSYNGTLIGSPSYTSTNNGGIIFDSVAKYVTLPASGLAFGTGQFAIEAWVFSTAAVSYNHIYSSQSSNNVGFISLYYQNGYGFSVADLGNSAVRTATTHQTVVSQNTWYHVVGIRNTSNQYIVYVNGVESTTNSTSSYPLTATAPQIASNPASNTERFTGTIASFRLYNTSLSAAQVLQNYNATKGRFGL